MKRERTNKQEQNELTDEQLNEVSGGFGYGISCGGFGCGGGFGGTTKADPITLGSSSGRGSSGSW